MCTDEETKDELERRQAEQAWGSGSAVDTLLRLLGWIFAIVSELL